ncbi:MAG: hypothetical protein H0U86_06485 [Chloroflexi bacterium]|nr:hypothetical protein [Chloroflexota bacterium]
MALVLGGILGYIALILREMGWAIAAVVTGLLGLFYWTRGRQTNIGWLLVGLGAVPAVILGRNGLVAFVDPSMEVGQDTWVMLAVAVAIGVVGALVIYAYGSDSRRSEPT